MQPVEQVVEARAQLRLLLGHSHAVFNVWRGSHLYPANGVGSNQLMIASTCPPTPLRPGVPFVFALSLFGWAGPAEKPWRGSCAKLSKSRMLAPVVVTQPYAPHQRHSLDASGLRSQYHTLQQHRPCTPHQSQSLGTCRTTAPLKLFAQLTKCKPGAVVFVYPHICDRDAWPSQDQDRQHSPRRGRRR